ncbi:MAG: FAD-binding oxidoreductase [Thermoplasmata archaeon]
MKNNILPTEMKEELTDLVGSENFTDSSYETGLYSHDLARIPAPLAVFFERVPSGIILPQNAMQVLEILRIARKYEVPVIPRGKGTWALGGAVPQEGGLVIDTSKLDSISIDKEKRIAYVGAGTVFSDLMSRSSEKGLMVPAYPSSYPGASVGGWIAVGGVGIGAYGHGGASSIYFSLQVVVPDGIYHLGRPEVEDMGFGYPLSKLLPSSEGTLGVITAASIKLVKQIDVKNAAFHFPDEDSLGLFLHKFASSHIPAYHVAFFGMGHLELVEETAGKEAEGERKKKKEKKDECGEVNKEKNRQHETIGRIPESPGTPTLNYTKILPGHGAVCLVSFLLPEKAASACIEETTLLASESSGKRLSQDAADYLWSERAYEFRCKRQGTGINMATGLVPLHNFQKFTSAFAEAKKSMNLRGGLTGILVSGHTLDMMPYHLQASSGLDPLVSLSFNAKMAREFLKLGGTPMGLGLWLACILEMDKEYACKLELMEKVRNAFDPSAILNPGKTLSMTTRWGVDVPPAAFQAVSTILEYLRKVV